MTATQVWDAYLEVEQLEEEISNIKAELAELSEMELRLTKANAQNTPLLEGAREASQAAIAATREKRELLESLQQEEQALSRHYKELRNTSVEISQRIEEELLTGRELLRVAKALDAYRDIWRPHLVRDETSVLKLARNVPRRDRHLIPALGDGKSSVEPGKWSDLTDVLEGIAAKRNAITSGQVEA